MKKTLLFGSMASVWLITLLSAHAGWIEDTFKKSLPIEIDFNNKSARVTPLPGIEVRTQPDKAEPQVTVNPYTVFGGQLMSPVLKVAVTQQVASAIRWSRNRVFPSSQPIPQNIRDNLARYFPSYVLEKARFSIDWGATQNATLQQFILGNELASAVTMDDVIIFREVNGVSNLRLWAHELQHVMQYDNLGVEAFASRYLDNYHQLEDPAYALEATVQLH